MAFIILSASVSGPLARAVYLHGSSDRVSLSFPSFSGLKSHSPCKAATFCRFTQKGAPPVLFEPLLLRLGPDHWGSLVEKSVNTIRFRPLMQLRRPTLATLVSHGCAPMGHILYDEIMRYNPKNPTWFNRWPFHFVCWTWLHAPICPPHLAGYDSVQEEDLKNFRQWESRTPGHPENFETLGVEVTTGPRVRELPMLLD